MWHGGSAKDSNGKLGTPSGITLSSHILLYTSSIAVMFFATMAFGAKMFLTIKLSVPIFYIGEQHALVDGQSPLPHPKHNGQHASVDGHPPTLNLIDRDRL